MTPRPPTGIALATASVLLATAGIGVLAHGLDQSPRGQHRSSVTPATQVPALSTAPPPAETPSQSSTSPSTNAGPGAPSRSATSTPAARPPDREATVVGDGPAADAAIQKVLETANPPNLPAALEQQLTTLGKHVWLAQVTGQGRETRPTYFRDTDTRWVYTRVRIQAAIARQTSDAVVQVKVVWAGTDPSGRAYEAQPATVQLQQRAGTWEPEH